MTTKRNMAEFRWRNDFHSYFLDDNKYKEAVDARDALAPEILNATTDAELKREGDGLKFILAAISFRISF